MLPTDSPLPILTISLITILSDGKSPSGPAERELTESYWLHVAFEDPTDPERHEAINHLTTFDYDKLRRVSGVPILYGSTLTGMLFEVPSVRKYFEDAWLSAFRTAKGLRLVIEIDRAAPRLHGLRWEALCHPQTGRFLFTDANLPFSRYLEKANSGDWREYILRPKGKLKTLVVVANPKRLAEGDGFTPEGSDQALAAIDVPDELRRARKGLQGLQMPDELVGAQGSPDQATLKNLQEKLRDGYDILYLVCHGALLPGKSDGEPLQPYLLLENEEDPTFPLVEGGKLVDILAALRAERRPRLVVLASCQSAGTGRTADGSALAALGPQLAQAGIPAVIAMQSSVKMTTIEQFMPTFFAEVVKDGQIERAMALARSAAITAGSQDWWSPVLFTRLKDGQLFEGVKASDDPIETYLRIASQGIQFSRSVNRKMEVLWNEPFEGHILGRTSIQRQDLRKLIPMVFTMSTTQRYQRAVMLGSTGQGKTVALQWLRTAEAFLSMEKRRASDNKPNSGGADTQTRFTIPIYLSLNDLCTGVSLDDLVLKSVNDLLEQAGAGKINEKQLEKWVGDQSTAILFLIDDLEALITWRFGVGLNALTDFMSDKRFSDQQFLIACRSSSYQGQLGAVTMIELEDLSEEQVQRVMGPEYKEMNPQMRKIACNRSMLRLILEAQGQKLYSKGQLTQWWVEKSLELQGDRVDNIDTYLAKSLLEELAYEMRSTHTHIYTEEQISVLVNNYLNASHELYNWRDVLYILRNIGALERDPVQRMYSFVNRTFADYFSAAAVLRSPNRRQHVLDTVSDYWWRDTLEVLVGLEPKPDDLLYELIDRDVLVAAHCIDYAAIRPNSPVFSALIDGLVEYMDHESSARRKRMVERINDHNHERVPEVLLRRLHREWSSTVILSIVQGLERSKRRFSAERLVATENTVRETITQDSVSFEPWLCISIPSQEGSPEQLAAERDGYIAIMQHMMENQDFAPRVRGMAAISLGLTHEEQVIPPLLERIRDPAEDDLVAWCASEALTEFQNNSLYLTVCGICEAAAFQEMPRHLARFIYLLRWNITYAEDAPAEAGAGCGPDASWQLLLNALRDPHPIVRGSAVITIACLGFRDSCQEIQNLLRHEREPFVLGRIAEALAQVGTPESIKLLESKMKDGTAQEYQTVRSAFRSAIKEIQERYGL